MAQAQVRWNGARDYDAVVPGNVVKPVGTYINLGYPRLGVGRLHRTRPTNHYDWVVPYFESPSDGRCVWNTGNRRGLNPAATRMNPHALNLTTLAQEDIVFQPLRPLGLQADGEFAHVSGSNSQHGDEASHALPNYIFVGNLRRWNLHVARWQNQVSYFARDRTGLIDYTRPWDRATYNWSGVYPLTYMDNGTVGYSAFSATARRGVALLTQARARQITQRMVEQKNATLPRGFMAAQRSVGNSIEEWTFTVNNLITTSPSNLQAPQQFEILSPADNVRSQRRITRGFRLSGASPPWPPSDRVYGDNNDQVQYTQALLHRWGSDRPAQPDQHYLWREYYEDVAWWIYQVFRIVLHPRLSTRLPARDGRLYTPDAPLDAGNIRINVSLNMVRVSPWIADASAPLGVICPRVPYTDPAWHSRLFDAADMVRDAGWALQMTSWFHRQQHQGERVKIGGYDVADIPADSDPTIDGTYNFAFAPGCRLQFMIFRQVQSQFGLPATTEDGQYTVTQPPANLLPTFNALAGLPLVQYGGLNMQLNYRASLAFCQPLPAIQTYMKDMLGGRYDQGWCDDSWAYPLHCVLINALRGFIASKPVDWSSSAMSLGGAHTPSQLNRRLRLGSLDVAAFYPPGFFLGDWRALIRLWAETWGCQFAVWEYDTQLKLVLREGEHDGNPICLLYLPRLQHMLRISSPQRFWKARYFCRQCLLAHHQAYHRCDLDQPHEICAKCLQTHIPDPPNQPQRACNECGRYLTPTCQLLHAAVCATSFWCHLCQRTYTRQNYSREAHQCGKKRCRVCQEYVWADHECYMTAPQTKKPWPVVWVFDFECGQQTGVHEVEYYGMQPLQYATVAEDQVPYHCGTTLDSFMERCLQLLQGLPQPEQKAGPDNDRHGKTDQQEQGLTLIAHNGSGYDFQLVLNWLYEHPDWVSLDQVEPLFRGSKILQMLVHMPDGRYLRFIDSYRFIDIPLAKFPETFGLTEVKKGFFPYFYEGDTHAGPTTELPTPEEYGRPTMSAKRQVEFDKWYAEQKEFDYQRDMADYCRSDVILLRQGCQVFRQVFLNTCQTDPWCFMTIAGLCLYIYQKFHMPAKTVAILPIEQRDFIAKGFCGGRTEPFKLYYEANLEAGEEVHYYDVRSLYPWVNATAQYPVGHAEWWYPQTPTDTRLHDTWIGWIEVDVTPPDDLYLPILPQRKDGKLMFDLVPKTQAVYFIPELRQAVAQGYRVTRIYRALLFRRETDTLFKSYVRTMFKIKVYVRYSAAGCTCCPFQGRRSKVRFLLTVLFFMQCVAGGWEKLGAERGDTAGQQAIKALYERLYDIDLSEMTDTYNAGMYYMAKRCLNSLWGKFGQKPRHTQTQIVTSEEALWKLLDNKEIVVKAVHKLGESALQVSYASTEEYLASHVSGMTNMAVAAATTAWARLKLYSGLAAVGERALYCDTDSIIYKWRPGQTKLTGGAELGAWASELACNDPIEIFVSTGPKSYGYRTRQGKQTVKIKGFTLIGDVKERLSLDTLSQMVCEESLFMTEPDQRPGVEVEYEHFIVRHAVTHEMKSKTLKKKFRVTFDKRLVQPLSSDKKCLDTWPVGFGMLEHQAEMAD